MTIEPESFGAETQGASSASPEEPVWVNILALADYSRSGFRIVRDHMYTVDINSPDARHALAAGWITVLPKEYQ